jgi:hypothetical protein
MVAYERKEKEMSELPKKVPEPEKEKRPVPTNRDPRTGDYTGDQGGYHD